MTKFKNLFSQMLAILLAANFAVNATAAEQANMAGADLELNGIAVQSELRQEWFLNALYLPAKLDDTQAILADTGIKRMELKVLADSLSGRRIKRFWIEKIRNNNEGSIVLAQARDVRGFASTLGQNLVANDVIFIDLIPNDATVVSINGFEVARFSTALFNLVVNTWIGERPPSQEFKAAILGNQEPATYSSLLAKSASIEPMAERVAEFDSAAKQAIEDARLAEEERQRQAQLQLEAEQKAIQDAEDERNRLAQQQADQVETQRLEDLAAQQAADEAKAAKAAEESALQQPVVEEVPAGPTEAELATLRSNYARSIRTHYVPFFEYPLTKILRKYGSKAYRRPRKGQSFGTVVISVELDRDGDLVGGTVTTSSGEKILDNAVSKALLDAEPYPAMPTDLPEDTFKTNVTISIPAPQQ